jgi:hypothetical protein
MCDDRGIVVKLVASPYYVDYINSIDGFKEWKFTFISSLPDPSLFYDYTASLEGAQSFADVIHINRSGSATLLKQMLQDGVFGEIVE